jgi:hypothetical protein
METTPPPGDRDEAADETGGREPGAKDDQPSRPDRPTDSDAATLVERDEGAHAEYLDAPDSLAEDPPAPRSD